MMVIMRCNKIDEPHHFNINLAALKLVFAPHEGCYNEIILQITSLFGIWKTISKCQYGRREINRLQ